MISNTGSEIKFVFVHATKTGGNSVNKALERYGIKYPLDNGFTHQDITYPHSQHWTLKELSLVIDIEDYYTFSISRNPWDRMVSYYRKNVCNPNSNAYVDAEFNDWVQMAFVDKCTPEHEMRIDNRYSHKGEVFSRQHDGLRDIDECYYHIKDDNGKIGVDFVIEFSLLKEGFGALSKKLGIASQLPEIPIMRSGVRTHNGRFFDINSYHEMYNSNSVDIIESNFKNDILIFGYNYE